MIEARWWRNLSESKTACELCPRSCVIANGKTGFCGVRKNIDGRLFSLIYGNPVAVHVDPIEKKPLYHFLPGSRIYSIGTLGCNLGCLFCQNWDISRVSSNPKSDNQVSPEQIIQFVLDHNCRAIAFTYNEPTIFGEYVFDISLLAKQIGLKTVMVTNGYISKQAITDIYPLIDAANIDLKSFSEAFYKKYCQGNLQPVLDAIVRIREMGTFIELTTLLIPDLNDSDTEIQQESQWIVKYLGKEVPLHFSAFHPDYKMLNKMQTPKSTLDRARAIAASEGILYIYEGNVMTSTEENTYCPECGKLLIKRQWLSVIINDLHNGKCSCGAKIPVVE